MALQTPRSILAVFGWVTWGDLGEMTMYKSKRGKLVYFSKTYPDKPPSPKQEARRAAFAAATAAWRALSPLQRAEWTKAAHRACLCATGYNAFLHWKLTGDDAAIRTLERQTNTNLLPP